MAMVRSSRLEEEPVVKLNETLEDASYRSLQTQSHTYQGMFPGRKYYGHAIMHATKGLFKGLYVYGPCEFMWVCNRSGAPRTVGQLVSWYTGTGDDIDSGTVGTITEAAGWTAYEQVDNVVMIDDDAGAGGAPPEGEMRYIVKNTANVLTVQPDFSIAPAANDDWTIFSRSQIVASAAGHQVGKIAGIIMATSLADNYWGWILTKGVCLAAITPAAMAQYIGLIAGTNILAESSTSGDHLIVAQPLVAMVATDLDSPYLWPVNFSQDGVIALSA